MRTNLEERAEILSQWRNEYAVTSSCQGSEDIIDRLIADVDDALGLFERVLSGSADGLLLGEIRDYLKEPKQ